jgi:large subunit ribosomal protein L10
MRPEKASIVDELKGQLEGTEYAFLADYQGLTVAGLANLRSKLREQDSTLYVSKNTFIQVTVRDLKLPDISEHLKGPTAVVTGGGDAAEVAKTLLGFARENDKLSIRGGFVGKDVLSAADVDEMSRIPPRKIMLGRLVGTIAAPMSGLVGVMNQKLLSLVYVLKAAEEKKSNG